MLAYSFTDLHRGEYKNVGTEDFENIHNLFASILSKGIAKQLKQGLYREYILKSESLAVLRGKMNINGTVRNQLARRQQLYCEYDEMSENNIFNQILKTTAMELVRSKYVEAQYKDTLKKELLYFSQIDLINLKDVKWGTLTYQRNSRSYLTLMAICQLIAQGLLQSTEEGYVRMAEFIDDKSLHSLFENFVLKYYQAHDGNFKAKASTIDWAIEETDSPYLPRMWSDITLESNNKILIIDTKFYSKILQSNYDKLTIRSNNLYQIFTYVKNEATLNPEYNVSGMLLYAKTTADIQPDESYVMSGNYIHIRTIDLYQDFEDIKKDLNGIINTWLKN